MSELEKEIKRLKDHFKNVEIRMSELKDEVSILREQLKNLEIRNYLLNEENKQLILSSSKVDDNSVGKMHKSAHQLQSPMSLLPVELRVMIFKKLDVKSLKKARLVSQSWNFQATPILANCSQINLDLFFDSCKDLRNWTFPTEITPLIKHVHAPRSSKDEYHYEDMQTMIDNNKYNVTRWKQLKKFCKKYSNDIKGISADGEGYDYRQVLLHLSNVMIKFCPELQNLYLYGLQHEDVENSLKNLRKVEFSEPLGLKFIQLDFHFEWEMDRCEDLDNLFKISENLEVLKIFTSCEYYNPDLSNNKKLKSLEINAECQFVDIPKLNRMIQHVSSSLEILSFGEPAEYHNDENWHCLSFPSIMSQLKVFINEDLLTFRMDNFASLLRNCENLQTLQLTTPYGHPDLKIKITEKSIKGVTPHLKLKNLKIAEMENKSVLVTLLQIFPNLEKIDFTVGRINTTSRLLPTVEIENYIVDCFEICSNTKLVDITVTIKLVCSWITNILIKSEKLLAGFKMLTFANLKVAGQYSSSEMSDTEIEKFQNALLLTRELEIFQLKKIIMKATTVMKIVQFVSENHLPFRFID